jgi:hypothetical protein
MTAIESPNEIICIFYNKKWIDSLPNIDEHAAALDFGASLHTAVDLVRKAKRHTGTWYKEMEAFVSQTLHFVFSGHQQ